MLPIQEELNIEGNLILEEELNIVGYTNHEMAEETDKTAREYLQKFEDFHSPLEDIPKILIQRFIDKGDSSQQLHEIFVKNPSSASQCPYLNSQTMDQNTTANYLAYLNLRGSEGPELKSVY
ncbi:hypothetical protein C1646_768945 [Rhizophagus diaphanus]|nr:hypothetical protein C1646_768945 [Rhizophagus diaphanus] [Rhizophagus sp. MUCL 43196]